MWTFESFYIGEEYKAVYLRFCADGSWENRLALAEMKEEMIYKLDYTNDDLEKLEDEALEELEELEAETL